MWESTVTVNGLTTLKASNISMLHLTGRAEKGEKTLLTELFNKEPKEMNKETVEKAGSVAE